MTERMVGSTRAKWPRGAVLVMLLCVARAVSGDDAAEPATEYSIDVSVSLNSPHIEGRLEAAFVNTSDRVLNDAVFFLFPNRFAVPDEGINDFNRPFVYPEEEFVAGRLEITAARADGVPTTVTPLEERGLARGTAVRVAIPRLKPGARGTVTLRFHTVVPYRFGSFGRFEDQLTLTGGWHPYLASLARDGTWRLDGPPPLARFTVRLTATLDVLLNGKELPVGSGEPATVTSHYLSLIAAPQLLREETTAGTTRIVFYHRPARRSHRSAPGPGPVDMMLETLERIISRRPSVVPEPTGSLVVVQAPLRLDLTAPGEGVVIVSDRALEVHELIRPLHEAQVARAVYDELLGPELTAREPSGDYWWVKEGVADLLAHRYLTSLEPDTRSVRDWIELFNIFAIVDRFENAPRIPFVGAFFERSPAADPLRERIATFNHNRPPGHVVLGKLRELVGPDDFDALSEPCLTMPIHFRTCIAGAVAGRNIDQLIDAWLQPYPVINYRLESCDLNRREPDGYRHEVVVGRESSRPYTEPVTIRLRSIGGRDLDLNWTSAGQVARIPAVTDRKVHQVVIDPDRKLIEERRDDNACPQSPQIVLDSADVEVSSTDFGISGLVVARARYDYRKDLATAVVYTNRGVGFMTGPRVHWGIPIDPTLYRHNAYLFYAFQSLDGGFRNDARPEFHTTGRLGSLGLRYAYTNVFGFDNPTNARNLSIHTDWHDRTLGSDFNYLDWGVDVGLTHPLRTHRTISAVEVLNGFSEPFGSDHVPNQGLYSLGGSRSIRGIGAEKDLARNIFLLRSELRQSIYPEFDLNLLDLLILRRTQAHLFVDTGRVDDSAGRIYDVGGFAVGIGAGLAAAYDFMGFFPSLAYIEVATQVGKGSEARDVQVLFGTRQGF
jgi:hypothetical protein